MQDKYCYRSQSRGGIILSKHDVCELQQEHPSKAQLTLMEYSVFSKYSNNIFSAMSVSWESFCPTQLSVILSCLSVMPSFMSVYPTQLSVLPDCLPYPTVCLHSCLLYPIVCPMLCSCFSYLIICLLCPAVCHIHVSYCPT